MNVIYPYKIASKLFIVCALLDKYFNCQISICRSRQNFVLLRLFHKNTRTIRVNLLYPFSSLTISIHIRILEALLEKFLSNSYMLQTPRLFQRFSYNLHCLSRYYNYSLHAFKFSYFARSKQTSCIHQKRKYLQ